jgi:hypothetical protein
MRKLLLVVIASVTIFAAAQRVVGGPVVVNTTGNSATIMWIVQSDEVAVRPAAGGAPKTSPSLRAEKTTLTGLQPNTRYEYEIPGNSEEKGSFKTAALAGEPYHFVVYGDTRTRHDVHRRVVDAIVKLGVPDFVIHTGDLVANGNDSAMWPIFFDIEKALLRETAFFPSLGNHERNSPDFYSFFGVTTPYYSFNWGNGHFIVLNSDVGNVAQSAQGRDSFWAEQTRWLEDDLAANQKANFRFVIAHHPPFTAVSRRTEAGNPLMAALVPLFEKYHLTAGFFGHDHNYQHYLKNGIHYVITGGGGAPLYDVDKPIPGITVKAVSTEHFVTIGVEGKVARVEAIALDGRKLDEFELHPAGQ